MSNLILDKFDKNKDSKNTVPIWLMRQAGRYLPEYKKIRSKNEDFINFCLNIKDSSEVTLQPLERFNLDAAIIFSDILLINYAAGQDVKFKENVGPVLQKLDNKAFLAMEKDDFINKLSNCYKSMRNVRNLLHKDKTLIGFAGSPWTVLVYALNLKSPKNEFNLNCKEDVILELLNKFINLISWHCIEQIKNGADVIQLFDSWAGIIEKEKLNLFCENPNKRIIENIKKIYPYVPVICFPRNIKGNVSSFVANVKPDGISLDFNTDISKLDIDSNVVYQGGMRPDLLTIDDESEIINEAKKYLDFFKDKRYIFNLGHGVLPNTKIKSVEKLVNFVKNY